MARVEGMNLNHEDSDIDTDTVVQTKELTKRYGDRLAVDQVSLTVRRGEVYGFLGPNGAGKTTTLRMILGLIRPTSGSAAVLGKPAGTAEVTARVGALVEGPGFYPYLTGRDNLRVMARYRGLSETRRRRGPGAGRPRPTAAATSSSRTRSA